MKYRNIKMVKEKKNRNKEIKHMYIKSIAQRQIYNNNDTYTTQYKQALLGK
jgi:hypothetical protein